MEAAAAVVAPNKARLLILDISDPRNGLVVSSRPDLGPADARLWLLEGKSTFRMCQAGGAPAPRG